jgi:hypothetical protein
MACHVHVTPQTMALLHLLSFPLSMSFDLREDGGRELMSRIQRLRPSFCVTDKSEVP